MHFDIRPATPALAPLIAPILLPACAEVIAHLLGADDEAEALRFLGHWLARPANLYSYENTQTLWLGDELAAALIGYDGDDFDRLRAPLLATLRPGLDWPRESDEDFYIDTLAVAPHRRGRGLGEALLGHQLQQRPASTLLVADDKPRAKRFYARLGFGPWGRKTLAGHHYEVLRYVRPTTGEKS